MMKVNKITTLLFALLLFFAGKKAEAAGLSLLFSQDKTTSENSILYFSKQVPDHNSLDRQQEKVVTPVEKLPYSCFKSHISDFYLNNYSQELRILNINTGYLAYPETVYLNLSNCDIIYPFQYFW
jgi:hypothetical protein